MPNAATLLLFCALTLRTLVILLFGRTFARPASLAGCGAQGHVSLVITVSLRSSHTSESVLRRDGLIVQLMNVSHAVLFSFALAMNLPVAAVDEKSCGQDRDQLVASLEKNRESSLEPLQRALDSTAEKTQRELLGYQIEQIWNHDEQMRAMADQIWRDCVWYVRSLR